MFLNKLLHMCVTNTGKHTWQQMKRQTETVKQDMNPKGYRLAKRGWNIKVKTPRVVEQKTRAGSEERRGARAYEEEKGETGRERERDGGKR